MIFQLRLATQAISTIAPRMIGHGVFRSIFSDQISICLSGSKIASIVSPCSRVQARKPLSMVFFSSRREELSIAGNSSNQLIG